MTDYAEYVAEYVCEDNDEISKLTKSSYEKAVKEQERLLSLYGNTNNTNVYIKQEKGDEDDDDDDDDDRKMKRSFARTTTPHRVWLDLGQLGSLSIMILL